MRRVILLCAALLCLWLPAGMAEEEAERIAGGLDVSEWQAYADAAGLEIDVRETLLSLVSAQDGWDVQGALAALGETLRAQLRESVSLIVLFAAPALVCALAKQFAPQNGGVIEWIGVLAAASAMLAAFASAFSQAERAVSLLSQCAQAVSPLLIALLSAAGGGATAALLSPMAALAGGAIGTAAGGSGLALCACAAGVAAAGELSERIRLTKLFKLLRTLCNWLMGAWLTAFLAVVSVQGLLGAGYDSAAVRTAQYAVDNLMPVVGGDVADTMDALIGSAQLVKNAAGVTGLCLLLLVCVRPLLAILAPLLASRLAAAMIEPVEDGPVARLIDRFGDVLSMLLVVVVASCVMAMVLIGATLASGGAVR